jgi:hypothetical protein
MEAKRQAVIVRNEVRPQDRAVRHADAQESVAEGVRRNKMGPHRTTKKFVVPYPVMVGIKSSQFRDT